MSIDANSNSVKLSWSTLIAGIGVIVSVIFNYAAYDTRLTVMEKAILVDQKVVSQMQQDVKQINQYIYDIRVLDANQSSEIGRIKDDLVKVERVVENLDKRLRDLERKK